jgi:hypothetical protein
MLLVHPLMAPNTDFDLVYWTRKQHRTVWTFPEIELVSPRIRRFSFFVYSLRFFHLVLAEKTRIAFFTPERKVKLARKNVSAIFTDKPREGLTDLSLAFDNLYDMFFLFYKFFLWFHAFLLAFKNPCTVISVTLSVLSFSILS